ILVPAVVYIAICLLASLQQFDSRVTIIAICQTALYFIVAVPVFASLVKRTRDYLLAYYALCAVGGLLATAEMFYGSNYVLGLHKNGIGGSLACAVIVSAELWFAEPDVKRRRLLVL